MHWPCCGLLFNLSNLPFYKEFPWGPVWSNKINHPEGIYASCAADWPWEVLGLLIFGPALQAESGHHLNSVGFADVRPDRQAAEVGQRNCLPLDADIVLEGSNLQNGKEPASQTHLLYSRNLLERPRLLAERNGRHLFYLCRRSSLCVWTVAFVSLHLSCAWSNDSKLLER